jgi:hypothetical protein
MAESQYLVFLRPEIIPYLKSMSVFEILEINGSHYMPCATIGPSLLPGFLDVTLPRIQENQDFDFSISLPVHYVVYVCWAQHQTVKRILGFRSEIEASDNSPHHTL